MKTTLAFALACLFLQAAPAVQADPTAASSHREHGRGQYEAQQRAEIEQLLGRYAQALNAGDAAAVVELYANDGVLMAPESPSAVGLDAVRESYAGTFQAIRLNIVFDIAEVNLLSHEWAMLRTTSTGTITIAANGATIPEGNQELFLLHKSRGQWKIARYSFSTFLKPA